MGKRGPQKADGKREKNGRLSRKQPDIMKRVGDKMEKSERETLRPGIEARVRLHGVRPEDSRDQRAGSFVGRLCMGRELSARQYEAAITYLEDWENVTRSIGMPHSASAVDLSRVQGGAPGAEDVAFSLRAKARWEGARKAVQERQNELRGAGMLFASLDYCLLRDEEHFHLVGSLREALNALARHYQIGDKARAA